MASECRSLECTVARRSLIWDQDILRAEKRRCRKADQRCQNLTRSTISGWLALLLTRHVHLADQLHCVPRHRHKRACCPAHVCVFTVAQPLRLHSSRPPRIAALSRDARRRRALLTPDFACCGWRLDKAITAFDKLLRYAPSPAPGPRTPELMADTRMDHRRLA